MNQLGFTPITPVLPWELCKTRSDLQNNLKKLSTTSPASPHGKSVGYPNNQRRISHTVLWTRNSLSGPILGFHTLPWGRAGLPSLSMWLSTADMAPNFGSCGGMRPAGGQSWLNMLRHRKEPEAAYTMPQDLT